MKSSSLPPSWINISMGVRNNTLKNFIENVLAFIFNCTDFSFFLCIIGIKFYCYSFPNMGSLTQSLSTCHLSL